MYFSSRSIFVRLSRFYESEWYPNREWYSFLYNNQLTREHGRNAYLENSMYAKVLQEGVIYTRHINSPYCSHLFLK